MYVMSNCLSQYPEVRLNIISNLDCVNQGRIWWWYIYLYALGKCLESIVSSYHISNISMKITSSRLSLLHRKLNLDLPGGTVEEKDAHFPVPVPRSLPVGVEWPAEKATVNSKMISVDWLGNQNYLWSFHLFKGSDRRAWQCLRYVNCLDIYGRPSCYLFFLQ